MTAATDTNSRLSFNAGAATGTLTLDNVVLKKIDAPTDPELTGIAPKMGSVVAAAAEYAVYSLSGKRLGTVKIRHATETETLLKAKFGKGVYMLRSENGKKTLFHVK